MDRRPSSTVLEEASYDGHLADGTALCQEEVQGDGDHLGLVAQGVNEPFRSGLGGPFLPSAAARRLKNPEPACLMPVWYHTCNGVGAAQQSKPEGREALRGRPTVLEPPACG